MESCPGKWIDVRFCGCFHYSMEKIGGHEIKITIQTSKGHPFPQQGGDAML